LGANVKSRYKTLAVDELVTGDGHRLPPRLAGEIAREIQRLAMVQAQIAEIERERDAAPTTCEAPEVAGSIDNSLDGISSSTSDPRAFGAHSHHRAHHAR